MKFVKRFKKPLEKQKVDFQVNERVSVSEMVVIDELGEKLGILKRSEALEIAKSREMDLVLVSPNSNPPVARITNWDKFRYEKIKKIKKNSSNKSSEQKEWWIKPNIGDRDLEIRLNKVKDFLKEGGNAKLTVKIFQNKGGVKISPEDMQNTMNKILSIIDDFALPISNVLKEGRNLSVIIKLKK